MMPFMLAPADGFEVLKAEKSSETLSTAMLWLKALSLFRGRSRVHARSARMAGTTTRNGPMTRAKARARALASGMAGIGVLSLRRHNLGQFGGSQDYIEIKGNRLPS
jgi:hypothetical protein